YVVYTPELPIDAVEAEAPRFTPDDWWFRRVRVGVPRDFSAEDAEQIARRGLIACLKALKPEDSALIDKADEIVTTAGGNCRFLLKVRDLAKQTIEISTTINVHREPSLFYVAVTDKTTGAYREAPPAKIQSYDDGIYSGTQGEDRAAWGGDRSPDLVFGAPHCGKKPRRRDLGPVDKVDSQIGFAVIQDCFLGGGFGAWGFVGRRVAAHWRAFAG
uniref:hypothetical protein n=1 Tax=Devosia sp. TaxID=1871048 RepID=UPI002AFF34A7